MDQQIKVSYKRKFSEQSPSEFHKQESTVNKIEKTLNTAEQQQFNQTTSVISDSSSNNQSKLRNQFTQTESPIKQFKWIQQIKVSCKRSSPIKQRKISTNRKAQQARLIKS